LQGLNYLVKVPNGSTNHHYKNSGGLATFTDKC
jgi:hypothetical protein